MALLRKAGIEGGLLYNPYKPPASGTAQIYSFGGALGLYYFPLSRLFTRMDFGLGVYQGVIEEGKGKPGLWWRTGGFGVGFGKPGAVSGFIRQCSGALA
jgi:hypothetical protein